MEVLPTESNASISTKENKTSFNGPIGPKSRIPVLIRVKSHIKPDLQLKRLKSSFNSSFHHFSPGPNRAIEEEKLSISQDSNFTPKNLLRASIKRKCFSKKGVNFRTKELDYIIERENKLSSLPSRQANTPILDWDSRLRNADKKISTSPSTSPGESKEDRLLGETTLLLGHISDFFSQKSNSGIREGQSDSPAGCDADRREYGHFTPYTYDILSQCLARDTYYTNMLKKKSLNNINEKIRLELIQRVTQWSGHLKLDPEVVFIAVFIIDAFLQLRKCSDDCSTLLTAAAFLIAAKMDSVNSIPTIEELIRLAKFKYREKDLRWMEGFVLHKLSFYIFPPTPRYFMELCISQLEFPHEKVKSLVIDLTTAILLRSVTDHQQIPLRASLKAKTALLIATEYIMFHKSSAADIKKYLFFEKAVPKCYELYKKIVLQADQRTSLSSKLSNAKSRGSMKSAMSAHCILVQ